MKSKILLYAALLIGSITVVNGQDKLADKDIIDAVEDQYRFDHAVDVNNINVASTDGIVELTGKVSNIGAKDRAAKYAEMVKGVRAVSNRIEVVPPKSLSDADIRNNIIDALFYDPAADSYELNVKVNQGVATLSGTVDSYQEKELSGKIAKSVKGVTDLKNEILVEYKSNRPDYEIQKDIEQTLKWNKWVDDGLIDVKVTAGKAELSGVVGSVAEKNTATRASWIAGVKSVDNTKLDVHWWAKDTDLRANKNVSVSDEEIRKAIVDAALYDPRVLSFHIQPEVNNGWVTLRGTVDNMKAKKTAENLANSTLGVTGVINRLKVRSDLPLSDSTIENRIDSVLAINSITEAWQIDVSVNNGIATLSGVVDSYIEKEEAEWVASGVMGVIAVNNRLTVNYPYGYYWYDNYPYYSWYYPADRTSTLLPNDNVIKMNVENELWWSPYVDSDQVTVNVENGKVTLKGTVDSWKEYRKAAENAWEGGAWSLDNELVIDYSE